MRSQRWYARFPSDAYAVGPFWFEQPISERAFRVFLRSWAGSVPVGTECWPVGGWS